jgi:phenylacetic acid degradation protein
MARVYAIDDVIPVIDPSSFVHPDAVIIGDVWIGPGCYIGPTACLRGDFGPIRIGRGCNIQDTCVLHTFPGRPLVIEDGGHVGHGAVLHGCHIGSNALIGMNSVIMDNVVVGANAFVAAMAFVKTGFEVPPATLVAGMPAAVVRPLRDSEIAWKTKGTGEYVELAQRSMRSMRAVEPLSAPEPDRPSLPTQSAVPLQEHRGRTDRTPE